MSLQPSTVSVGSQILLGDDDVNGVEWGFSSIEGWHEPAGMNVDRAQRSVSHGEFAQRGHRTGRVIILSGYLWAEDRAKINAALTSLSALLADGGFDIFTFADSDYLPLWTEVQLLNLDADWEGGTKADPPRFQIQLLASDPYKYGETSTDSTGFSQTPEGAGLVFDLFEPAGSLAWGVPVDPGILTVSNPGTADAALIFTVDGPTPAAGFRIIDLLTGHRITYLGGAVPSGSSVVFDGRDGTIVIDGVADRSGDTVVEAWPLVPPGETRSFLFEPVAGSSAATLTGACIATYW